MASPPVKKNVWIDCDVGQDDVFALVLGMGSPEINLLGVSCCFGNSTLENTTQNTLRIMTAMGDTKVPVYKGLAKPILVNRPSMCSPGVHGSTGLGGTNLLPEATRSIEPIHAVAAMAETFGKMEDESVYLCITGPMTNAAFLFCLYPEITKKIKQVVIMGGAVGLAGPTPTSEMNIVSDPEAAETVFQNEGLCGKIVLITLETTHTALATKEVRERFQPEKSTFRRLLFELLSRFASGYEQIHGFQSGPPLHDPLTVYYVLHPEEFETKLMHVTVVLGGKADGKTICDIDESRYYTNEKKNVHLSIKTNPPAFWDKMIEAVEVVDALSPLK